MRKGMYLYGTGATLNIPLGGVPMYAELHNVEDGDRIDVFFRGKTIAFTSGGTLELKKGMKIKGATSGATALIREVLVKTGSFAGGDAAGVLIIDHIDSNNVGTFGSENVYVPGVSTGTDDATGSAAAAISGEAITTAVAAGTTLSAYVGDRSNSPGITLNSTASEDNKLLFLIYDMGEIETFAAAV